MDPTSDGGGLFDHDLVPGPGRYQEVPTRQASEALDTVDGGGAVAFAVEHGHRNFDVAGEVLDEPGEDDTFEPAGVARGAVVEGGEEDIPGLARQGETGERDPGAASEPQRRAAGVGDAVTREHGPVEPAALVEKEASIGTVVVYGQANEADAGETAGVLRGERESDDGAHRVADDMGWLFAFEDRAEVADKVGEFVAAVGALGPAVAEEIGCDDRGRSVELAPDRPPDDAGGEEAMEQQQTGSSRTHACDCIAASRTGR